MKTKRQFQAYLNGYASQTNYKIVPEFTLPEDTDLAWHFLLGVSDARKGVEPKRRSESESSFIVSVSVSE